MKTYRTWAVFAALAIAVAFVSLVIPHDALAALTAHDPVFTASAALIAMRADHSRLVTLAAAKIAEIKDGLAADAVATIEAAHADLLRQAGEVTAKITAEEARIAQASLTAAPTVKPWAAAFYQSAESLNVPLASLNAIVTASASHDIAKDALITALANAGNVNLPSPTGQRASVGAEARDKFVMGAGKSIIAKAAMFNTKAGAVSPDGERNEFSGLSLRELARMSLELSGVRTIPHDPMQMIKLAMGSIVMAGQLSTSDFVNILANVANKAMLKGYEESPETFNIWTGKGTLTDFKTVSRVDLGLFPTLAKVDEGAEYTYASMGDRGVNLVLATYGKIFPITRQAIINDDLGAFTKVPQRMGQAAKRTIGNLVYAILTANANMADGIALFQAANHKNLLTGGGSVLAASSLNDARTLMARQPDPDNIKQGLNIRPKYWVGPVTLEGTARQTFNSQSEPGQNNPGVGNRVQGMVDAVVPEARLDANSLTAWYLAADPAVTDTIEVDYLNGQEAPTLEQKDGWNVDGVEMKVRQDAGVSLLDFRGLVKSAGA
jgi:phage major head subunit gpT-like protein